MPDSETEDAGLTPADNPNLELIRSHRDRMQRSHASLNTKAAALLALSGAALAFTTAQSTAFATVAPPLGGAAVVLPIAAAALGVVVLVLGDLPSRSDYKLIAAAALPAAVPGQERWKKKWLCGLKKAEIVPDLTGQILAVWQVEDALAREEAAWLGVRTYLLILPYIAIVVWSFIAAIAVVERLPN